MSRLLHLSDPHFGREQASVVSALLALHGRLQPELVVVSGDLTQRAWPHQFRRAGEFFRALDARATLVVPGNHDVPLVNLWARLVKPYDLYQQTFGADLEPVYQTESLLVVGVDTSTPSRRVDGEVDAAQVRQSCELLRAGSAQQLKLVIVHQPVAVPQGSERQRLLHGAEQAVPAWVDAGADAVLGGHIHLPFVLPLSERYGQLQRRAWVIHAGTAVSDRLRMGQPNSVNELYYELAPVPQLQVTRWDYSELSRAFEPVEQHQLALERN